MDFATKCNLCNNELTTHGKRRLLIYSCGHWSCEKCALSLPKCQFSNCNQILKTSHFIDPCFEKPISSSMSDVKSQRLKNKTSNLEKLREELKEQLFEKRKILRKTQQK